MKGQQRERGGTEQQPREGESEMTQQRERGGTEQQPREGESEGTQQRERRDKGLNRTVYQVNQYT